MLQKQREWFQGRFESGDHQGGDQPFFHSIVKLSKYLIIILIAGAVPLLFLSISRFKEMVMLTMFIITVSGFVMYTDKKAFLAWLLLLLTAFIRGFPITPDGRVNITATMLLLPAAVIWMLFSSQGVPVTLRGFKAPLIVWCAYLLTILLTTIFFGSIPSISATAFFYPFSFLLYLIFWERLHTSSGSAKLAYYSGILLVIAALESLLAVAESFFHVSMAIFIPGDTSGLSSNVRAVGSIGTHTGFGNYLAILLPFLFAHFSYRRNLFKLLAIVGGSIALFLSGTRITYMAALVSLLFMVIIEILRKVISLRQVLGYVAVIVILLIAIAIPLSGRIADYYQASLIDRGDTMTSRIMSFETAFKMVKESYGLGVGLRNYQVVALEKNYYLMPPHNSYLMILTESGLLGLVLFLLTLFLIFGRAIKVIRTADTGSFRFYAALAASGSLISFMICSILNMTIDFGHSVQLLWNIIAIGLVCSTDREPQQNKLELIHYQSTT